MRTARPAFPALVRGDDGSLHVRIFATAAAANDAARANPSLDYEPATLRDPWKHTGSPADLAKALGGCVSARTLWQLARSGGLPARDDGAGAKKARYRLPIRAILASIKVRGLRATVAAHRAGERIA